jgi:mannose/cellobiose epimerase-like protein (N-acyl-D-glucosamine 2-epimerase family)
MTGPDHPRDPDSLAASADRILAFYHPECIDDEAGGYVAQFDEETGDVYDRESKHLVAQCRFVVNYSLAAARDGPAWSAAAAEHGIEFLLGPQRDRERGGFHWLLDGTDPVDSRRICYGHAFALLAFARAVEADLARAADGLAAVYDLIDERFWEPDRGLCKSTYDAAWSEAEAYRGQNANMHVCEALIAAYVATDDGRFRDRALTIAESLAVDLPESTGGLVWEHYTPDWEPDFEYNRDDPTHTFRPWGYQPGHQIEWAKLLAVLDRHADADWLVPRAEELFGAAIEYGWDADHGGFYYSFDRDGDPVVTDKYSWEIAEAIGAAAALHDRTGDSTYLDWYDRFWAYASEHLVNPEFGNWYTKVTEDNDPVPTRSGVAVEPGYHPIGACLEGIRSLE